jgi:hypothetical protein
MEFVLNLNYLFLDVLEAIFKYRGDI